MRLLGAVVRIQSGRNRRRKETIGIDPKDIIAGNDIRGTGEGEGEYRGEQDTRQISCRAPDKEGGGGSEGSERSEGERARGLGAELGVLLCEDETAESDVAFRFLRRKCRFVRGQLLGSEFLDSRDDGRELLVGCDLLR